MRDIHCHILPGVDDGAVDMDQSLAMLDAAVDVGIDSIVCTPHCREPYFDFMFMWDAFTRFKARAREVHPEVQIHMGFEVNYRALCRFGFNYWASCVGFSDGSQGILLEFSKAATRSDFASYERDIEKLQDMGYEVIVAHPERYSAIQDNIDIAYRLVEIGCKLQASANFIAGGSPAARKRTALALFDAGLYGYLASDAHNAEHYRFLSRALRKYGDPTEHAE